jgi:hypothetical protein
MEMSFMQKRAYMISLMNIISIMERKKNINFEVLEYLINELNFIVESVHEDIKGYEND